LNALAVVGVGIRAPGLPGWVEAAAILAGVASYEWKELPRLMPTTLPMTERRRANDTSRLAIAAAADAMAGLPAESVAEIASVFASADGDGVVLADLLAALAKPERMVSPTLFHNSVFNAPAGYWAIGANAGSASTAVCAGKASFAAGLLEAWAHVTSTGRPVCLVAVDIPFPSALRGFATGTNAFACALLLGPGDDEQRSPYGRITGLRVTLAEASASSLPSALADRFEGNAAAAALPLLERLSRRASGTIALPYLDNKCLAMETAP